MNHIALICPAYTGHLNPMSTLGRELRRRGHRVTLISTPDAEGKARAADLEFLPVGEKEFPVGSMARFAQEQGALYGLAAVRYILHHIRRNAEVLLRDLPALIEQGGMDALLNDQVAPAANAVAEYLDAPYITISNAMALNTEPDVPPFMTSWDYHPSLLGRWRNALGYRMMESAFQPVVKTVNGRRCEWGMPPVAGLDYNSDLAQIVQQPEFLDFPRKQLAAGFHYTGPFHDDRSGEPVAFPWERLDGRPLIYASMGTLQNGVQRVFQIIADACAGLDAQLVISLGSQDAAVPAGLPGDPVVVPYAPQLDLLARADLVITHAGLNTVLETLTHGVPMVALPVTNDQPGVAARLKYLGAGEFIPVQKLTASALRAAVSRVRADPAYRENARACQRRIAETDGLRRAADIVETTFGVTRCVPARCPALRPGRGSDR